MGTSDLYLDWDTLKNLFEMIFALLLLQLVLYNVEAQFLPNRDYEVDYRRLPRMEEVLSVEDGEYGENGEDGEDGEYGEGTEKALSGGIWRMGSMRRMRRMWRMGRMGRIWRIWRIRKIWRMRRIWRIWRRGWGGCFLSPDHRKLNMCYSPTHA